LIPESNIVSEIGSLWIERFPEGDTTAFPKGLLKRISNVPIRVKDEIVTGQYRTRISLLWYDVNTILFDTKMASLISSISDIVDEETVIQNVSFEGRTDGYDSKTDMHIMNLDFIFKHTL